MLLSLSEEFGDTILFENQTFFSFPSPAKLANATLRDLAKCGLGYRAKYVSQTASKVCDEDSEFDAVKKMSYDEAKASLVEFPGVGPKVADCVLLFGFGRLEAFPVDVWIKRALLRHYSSHFPSSFVEKLAENDSLSDSAYKRLSLFGREHFGKYAGYAQEYLYHNERTHSGM